MTKDKEKYTKIGINTNSIYFKNWFNSGLLNDVDEAFALDVQKFWMDNYDTKVDPTLHMAFMNLTGQKSSRLIPRDILNKEIYPVFNDYGVTSYYGDKNIYGTMIKPPYAPETIIRKIGGNFFDSDYNPIDFENAHSILLNYNTDMVIKPSKSNNGRGVAKFSIRDNKVYFNEKSISFIDLLKIYNKDFIIQQAIEQHPDIAAPHPSSVNTIRIVTFRWKGEIRYLFAFARFGINNDIRDNATVDLSPAVGITDSGDFFDVGINKDGQTFTHHPTTNFCFADLNPIPNYEEFKQFIKDSHKDFIHLDIISWDIAVGLDGKPIILECNFAGSTPFYQMVSQKPFFGDLTEEVLEYIRSEWKSRKPLLMKKHRKKTKTMTKTKTNQENTKKLKKQNQLLQHQLEIQEKELRQLDDKYRAILNSKSFRYTRPLRKISKKIK